MNFKKFKLYYSTIKPQSKAQLFFRLKNIIKNKLIKTFPNKYNNYIYETKIELKVNSVNFFNGVKLINNSKNNFDLKKYKNTYDEIYKNKFKFLNQEYHFDENIDWYLKDYDQLWVFNLHYFDYLTDLAIYYSYKKDNNIYKLTQEIILSWIKSTKPSDLNSWHPYVISLRAVNWIKYYLLCQDKLKEDNEFRESFLESLYQQIIVLYNNLEYHLGANHLLENGKALIFAGALFDTQSAKKWFAKGMEIIEASLKKQILSDGGHYEKSPMYHSIVLKDYLEIIHLLKSNNLSLKKINFSKIKKMISFLKDLSHPDGEISFFNDSAINIEASPAELVTLFEAVINNKNYKSKKFDLYTYLLTANKINKETINYSTKKLVSYSDSGYFRLKNKNSYLIFDSGDIGPDENPGHAHCDTLSYELTYKKKRWVVNSGTYSYHSHLRNKFRSTAAHNTLRIDKKEQSQIWSKFRVGERAKAECNSTQINKNIIAIIGEHDGYSPITHKRNIILIQNEYWLIYDKLKGKGKHLIENYVHLSPDLKIEKISNLLYKSSFNNNKLYIKSLTSQEFYKENFYYSKEFNQKEKNTVLVQRSQNYLPAKLGYLLLPENVFNKNLSINIRNNVIEIIFENHKDIITFQNKKIDFIRKE
ncbi:MAG: heparinase II/III domain-containing protein [Bacillota bacterium]